MTEELPYLAWAATAALAAALAPGAAPLFAVLSLLGVALAVWMPVRSGGFVDPPRSRLNIHVKVDTTAFRAAVDRALATSLANLEAHSPPKPFAKIGTFQDPV